jgi:hypothetical protein
MHLAADHPLAAVQFAMATAIPFFFQVEYSQPGRYQT